MNYCINCKLMTGADEVGEPIICDDCRNAPGAPSTEVLQSMLDAFNVYKDATREAEEAGEGEDGALHRMRKILATRPTH